ncbi:MAG TPA: NAD(P)-dependent oxidoreductase [Solirubrobacteraceae bacterium]|jgi:3-hydroxyisobutyrate dehydrogenase
MGPPRTKLAFIGLGRMGLPMCARLISAGFEVRATDLRSEPRRAVVSLGGGWAQSAAEACTDADIAVTVLPGPDEVAAVADEVLDALPRGACWIEMSTASPAVARSVKAAAAVRELSVVEAPVGGGPAEAGQGRLLAFAGGEAGDLERCRPVLDALAARVFHVGPSGSGYAVKLFVNALWFTQAAASAELLTVGDKLGLDLDVLRQAFNLGASGGRFVAEDLGSLLDGDNLTSFSLARCLEELASVQALGRELGVELDLISAVTDVHRSALRHYGDVDGELLGARWVAERAGVELERGG